MRILVALSVLAIAGCDVQSTVGYDDSALGSEAVCGADAPIAACETGTCVVTDVTTALAGSVAIAVDGEAVYFVSAAGSITRRPLDGGAVVDLATNLDQMQQFTVDDVNLYWTEWDSRILGVPKRGGDTFTVATPFGNMRAIAVDAEHIYAGAVDRNFIAMVPKPSGSATQLAAQADPEDIAIDATYVYWLDGGTGAADGQLARAKLGDLTSVEVLLSNLVAPARLAVSDDAIFFASQTTLWRMPKSGGAATVLADGFGYVQAIATFGATLYVADQNGLIRLPAAGGAQTILDPRGMSAMQLGCDGVYASAWYESTVVRYGP